MKVLKGKTISRLKDKISSGVNKKRKSKPMIRKIEDGEDLSPEYTSAADIIHDIQELEKVHDSKPKESPDYPMDETPSKQRDATSATNHKVDKVPSQLFIVEEEKAQPSKMEEDALWKLQEPEIGEEIPDQDDIQAESELVWGLDEDENDYHAEKVDGKPPVAIIGNIVLVPADKQTTLGSPFSTAPTEPTTPEEALKRSFTVESLSDEEDFYTNYVHKTAIYTVPDPEDEETRNLWQSLEKNVQLSQNLIKDFNYESHVEKAVSELGFTVKKTEADGIEVTVSDPEQEDTQREEPPRDLRKTVGETIEKKSYIDVTKFQIPSAEDAESNKIFQVPISMDDGDEVMEESVLTVQMANTLNTSFDVPFDQKEEMIRMEMGPIVINPSSYVHLPHVADEDDEFPMDEMEQEAKFFFQEIEEEESQDDGVEETKEEIDSNLYGTTLSVTKSVAEGVTTSSVASATAKTVATAADTLDKAAVPTLDTIFEKTSEMTPTVFDGFFENPKPATKRSSKQVQANDDSFQSDNSDYSSEDAQMEPDVESVESGRYGFDKTMDSWFASETFTAVTKHVPDFVMQMVIDTEDEMRQPDLMAMQ